MSASSSLVLTIFSSIPEVAPAVRKAAPATLKLLVIEDKALGGYGGTVEFDPTKLEASTVQSLQNSEALVTEPSVLAALLKHHPLPALKWCQSTYAGVDPMFHNAGLSLPLPFTLTRFAGKFGPPMAEWCLARIIGHERKFAFTTQDQTKNEWAGHREVTQYRYLRDLTLTILGGAGDIGSCIGKAAQAFGMTVIGHGKTERKGQQKLEGLDDYTTDLSKALDKADYIVSVLPSTPFTRGMLSGDALKPAKGAVFVNVGRGDILDEASLIRALEEKYISAAILDVFATEPLPKNSPLWDRTDVLVSPHVSGVTRAQDVPDVVLENYQRYIEGQELLYQVDWSKGY